LRCPLAKGRKRGGPEKRPPGRGPWVEKLFLRWRGRQGKRIAITTHRTTFFTGKFSKKSLRNLALEGGNLRPITGLTRRKKGGGNHWQCTRTVWKERKLVGGVGGEAISRGEKKQFNFVIEGKSRLPSTCPGVYSFSPLESGTLPSLLPRVLLCPSQREKRCWTGGDEGRGFQRKSISFTNLPLKQQGG